MDETINNNFLKNIIGEPIQKMLNITHNHVLGTAVHPNYICVDTGPFFIIL